MSFHLKTLSYGYDESYPSDCDKSMKWAAKEIRRLRAELKEAKRSSMPRHLFAQDLSYPVTFEP